MLAGFVNGIFLCFIAMSIMIKALERLIEPPEIKTERLLLVSVLGFFVNLIGIFAFHGDMFFCGSTKKKKKKKLMATKDKEKSHDRKITDNFGTNFDSFSEFFSFPFFHIILNIQSPADQNNALYKNRSRKFDESPKRFLSP